MNPRGNICPHDLSKSKQQGTFSLFDDKKRPYIGGIGDYHKHRQEYEDKDEIPTHDSTSYRPSRRTRDVPVFRSIARIISFAAWSTEL